MFPRRSRRFLKRLYKDRARKMNDALYSGMLHLYLILSIIWRNSSLAADPVLIPPVVDALIDAEPVSIPPVVDGPMDVEPIIDEAFYPLQPDTDDDCFESGSDGPGFDSSDDGSEEPQVLSDDEMWYAACKWMKDRPVEDLKMMSVLLTLFSKMNFNLGKVAAAELAGSVVGRTGRSVRGYVSDFARNGGRFSPYRRGRHYRLSITSHEDFRHKAAEWARKNTSVRGKPNMTAADFSQYINKELLPSIDLPASFRPSISVRTSLRLLRSLGFHQKRSSQKGVFVDGHERFTDFLVCFFVILLLKE